MAKKFKITIISMKDNGGGGGFTAAYRLFLAILKNEISIDMLVQIKNSTNSNVVCPINKKDKFKYLIRVILTRTILKIFGNKKNPDQTLAFFNSGWNKIINGHSSDIINLHWVAGEMMSIEDISNISKPVVWTLHDMWAFSGVTHISYDGKSNLNSSCIKNNNLFDIDLNALKRKKNFWIHPIHIVTPSNWLASHVKNSEIMKNWPVTVIPNIIETSLFKPLNKKSCKKIFGLNENKKIILFGAFAGIVNQNKGMAILLQSLDEIPENLSTNFELVIFGQKEPLNFKSGKFRNIRWMGHIDDEKKMCDLYNASDIVAVPSKIEAFGLVAAEAHACGVPVVAFRNSGIQEVVSHKNTGYLAIPFEYTDFASGIIWTLKNTERLSISARKKACDEWSPEVIVPKYIELYKTVIYDFNNK